MDGQVTRSSARKGVERVVASRTGEKPRSRTKRQGGNGRGDAVRLVRGSRPRRASAGEACSSRGVKATLSERLCVALTGRDGATRFGRRERELESSEVEPVPGATAWKLARGVSRRGGNRTTRAEHDGSGGTDLPKGATPGVDARQGSR